MSAVGTRHGTTTSGRCVMTSITAAARCGDASLEHLARRLVDPVQVLDDHDHRAASASARTRRATASKVSRLSSRGRQVRQPLDGQRQDPAEDGIVALEVLVGLAEPVAPPSRRPPRPRRPRRGRSTAPSCHERGVGHHLRHRRAAGLEDRGVALREAGARTRRSAATCRCRRRRRRRTTCGSRRSSRAKQASSCASSSSRPTNGVRPRSAATPSASSRSRQSEHLVGRHRLALALHVERTGRLARRRSRAPAGPSPR